LGGRESVRTDSGGERHEEFSTGLGWPAERKDPQVTEGFPQATPQASAEVSRETSPPDRASRHDPAAGLSRETPTHEPADIVPFDEDTTPLARAVAEQLQQRHRVQYGEPVPRQSATRLMVVANQKGGVGKTTTTVNIAAALAQLGQRVLVIDLDPQGNASTALAIEHRRGVKSSYDVLVDGMSMEEAVQAHPEIPGLFVVPATIDLAGAEIELVNTMSRESRLRKAIAAHPWVDASGSLGAEQFDFVLVDCPPSLGLLTLNALVAGAEVLIPIQAEYYALEGLGQLLETIEMVRAHLNPDLVVSTILITMYDARTRLSAGVAEEVREHFADQVLDTAIPRSVRVSEAPSYGQSVMTYDPASPGALSYLEAARELATKEVVR
jgi:chromosome partitioning protein